MLSIERQSRVGPSEAGVGEVREWFNNVYREQGRRYLRAPEAYELFLALLEVEPGRRLLDVACGPGQLLSRLPARGVEGYGVDLSETALGLLRQGDERSSVQQADAGRLPYRDASFDYITCVGALERMPRLDEVLDEFLRVSRDDARFCFMVRNSKTLTWRLIRGLGLNNTQGHQDAATLEEWTERFDDAGFRVVRVVADQWRRMIGARVRKRLGLAARFDEPKRSGIPLKYANEFVFVLRRKDRKQREGTSPPLGERERIARFYDTLSKFEYWRNGRRQRDITALTMHKGLVANSISIGPNDSTGPTGSTDASGGLPDAGAAALDQWFAARVSARRPKDVLDVGCGYGATLARIHALCGAAGHGLTLSPYQQSVHERVTGGGMQSQRIEVGDFESHPLGDYDAIISLETLVYANDLEAALARLGRSLRTHGRLHVLEDMLQDSIEEHDPDSETYRRLWLLRRVHTQAAFERGFARAGFEVREHIDLSERVASKELPTLERTIRLRESLHRLAFWEPAEHLSAAFLGGLYLEKLYSRKAMGYHYYELALSGANRGDLE